MTSLIYNIGTLFSFVIGNSLSYHTIPYLMITFPVIYLVIVFCFIHETPQFLIQKNRLEVRKFTEYE